MTVEVRTLAVAEAEQWRDVLADILVDCVSGGASIGFMDGFTRADAAAWWDGVLVELGAGPRAGPGARPARGWCAGAPAAAAPRRR